jgi:hypothetical protein
MLTGSQIEARNEEGCPGRRYPSTSARVGRVLAESEEGGSSDAYGLE